MYNKKLPPSIEPYMILLNINPNLNWNRFNVWRWNGSNGGEKYIRP